MKTVICLLAIVALAAAIQSEPFSVSSSLVGVLEGLRDDMPCGFPFLGIGSLAPLFVSHKTLDIDTSTLRVVGSVQNFTATGLNCFDILDLHNSAVRRKLTFKILFNHIEVNTLYALESDFQKDGFTVKAIGSGNANFALKGLLLTGTIKYGISVVNSKVSLKSLKIVPSLESFGSHFEGILGSGEINRRMNEELERSIPFFINEFGNEIADQFEAIVSPEINKFLFQYSLNDIISGIGGNRATGEKITCEQSEYVCS